MIFNIITNNKNKKSINLLYAIISKLQNKLKKYIYLKFTRICLIY